LIISLRSTSTILSAINKETLRQFTALLQYVTEIEQKFVSRPEFPAAHTKAPAAQFRDRIAALYPLSASLFEFVRNLLYLQYSHYLTYIGEAPPTATFSKPFLSSFLDHMSTIWSFHPSAVATITEMLLPFDTPPPTTLKNLIVGHPYDAAFFPILVPVVAKFAPALLSICRVVPPGTAMALLSPDILRLRTASTFLIRSLARFDLDELTLNIPQLVQSIRDDSCRVLQKFLRETAHRSPFFAHSLLWNILYEKWKVRFPDDPLPNQLVVLEGKILARFSRQEATFHEHEFGLIDQLAVVSTNLLPIAPERRNERLAGELGNVRLTPDMYVPSHPQYKILGIDAPQSRCLKSHARVPILVSFDVYDEAETLCKPFKFECIFKVQDDVRMDAMMIQFIDKFQRIFADAGLETYMNPYRVFATGEERGVIQCIRNAHSRHELGTQQPEELLALFIRRYGPTWSESFKRAQKNFVISMAPYSLLCYVFQVKDRHNANIMIDNEGHVIHIDFGFIFDIAPGGVKFEMSEFKLTQEMVGLMGGSKDAPVFREFMRLFVQCFLAARARYAEIEPIAALMINAGFPCFKPAALRALQLRFFLDRQEAEIVPLIEAVVTNALGALTTKLYDHFQSSQNQIFFI
jgi:phosphatidylinositol 4-kinase